MRQVGCYVYCEGEASQVIENAVAEAELEGFSVVQAEDHLQFYR